MPKVRAIDQFIRWAFIDEWPKFGERQGPSGLSGADAAMARWRAEGLPEKVHDGANRYGVVAFTDDRLLGLPHPDAMALHEAMLALDDLTIELPDDWEPLADIAVGRLDGADDAAVIAATSAARKRALDALFTVDRDGARRMRRGPRDLLMLCASMNAPPDWRCDPIDVRAVRSESSGKPLWFARDSVVIDGAAMEIEVDGYDIRRGRPKPNAFRKWECDPSPVEAIIARAECEVRWHALQFLVDELAGRLAEHEVVMVAEGVRPWETGEGAQRRVLPSLAPMADIAPRRPHVALGRTPRRREPVQVFTTRSYV